MNQLARWMKEADATQKKLLAKKARTSVDYLRHIASGRRNASMEIALRIENATLAMEWGEGIIFVKKESLNNQWRKL